ncbi:MAG: HNH endonuclease signature motif containing protein [Capnocytophaga sp.]|nr:HNH endonuclease signature motif containing protein [Capnocytophaga sp.]
MKIENSKLPLNYITIKVTKSRIDKGLLAIPVSLIDLFPKNTKEIYLIDEIGNHWIKNFTPYQSSSRECRIGGMKSFYEKYGIQENDELIIQILDDGKYRIIPEKLFQEKFTHHWNEFEQSNSEIDLKNNLSLISKISNLSEKEVLQNIFVQLSNETIKERNIIERPSISVRESVNFSLRKILLEMYFGKCQLSGFTFIMKNGKPYFEIHHIDANKGNHLKNLLVVSPNIHAQFTYCNLEQTFDDEGWLRKVKFNNEQTFDVFQIIDNLPKQFRKEIHF